MALTLEPPKTFFDNFILNYIMFKQDVLLAIHNLSELNAKIRSPLKFLLKQ